MSKAIAYTVLGLISLSTVLLSYFFLSMPSVNLLSQCFKTSMLQVDFCKSNKNYVKIGQIPEHFIQALIISEDSRFFQHNGFDFEEMKNSFQQNRKAQRFVRGGSTITQQLAKNAFLNEDKSYTRKIREAILAFQIERSYTKNEILEFYVNMVQFGKDVYGIKNASKYYFNKKPNDLSLIESIYLVQLLPNPVVFSRGFFTDELSDRIIQRLKHRLQNLYRFQRIDEHAFNSAIIELSYRPWFYQSSLLNLDVDENVESKNLEEEKLLEYMMREY